MSASHPPDELARIRRIPVGVLLEAYAEYCKLHPACSATVGDIYDWSIKRAALQLQTAIQEQANG